MLAALVLLVLIAGGALYINPTSQWVIPDPNLKSVMATAAEVATPPTGSRDEQIASINKKFAPFLAQTIHMAVAGDVDALVAHTEPDVVGTMGATALKTSYQKSVVPFFKDFTSITPEHDSVRVLVPSATIDVGMEFEETFVTTKGVTKTFVVGLGQKGVDAYILSIQPSTTLAAPQ